jgi:acetyl esterase/lipase
MLCPATDNPMISYYSSFDENASGYGFTKDKAQFNFQNFTEKTEWFKNDAALYPIYEKEFSTLPPHLIMVTEFDVLRDEGIAYGKKLEKAGNDVTIKCFPHMIHNMAGLPTNSGEVNRVYELMNEAITKIDAPKDKTKK